MNKGRRICSCGNCKKSIDFQILYGSGSVKAQYCKEHFETIGKQILTNNNKIIRSRFKW